MAIDFKVIVPAGLEAGKTSDRGNKEGNVREKI
jgi:hypothetical protein